MPAYRVVCSRADHDDHRSEMLQAQQRESEQTHSVAAAVIDTADAVAQLRIADGADESSTGSVQSHSKSRDAQVIGALHDGCSGPASTHGSEGHGPDGKSSEDACCADSGSEGEQSSRCNSEDGSFAGEDNRRADVLLVTSDFAMQVRMPLTSGP